MAEVIVSKFGGSSLSHAAMFEKVARIVVSNPQRRVIVPSAPGKRNSGDSKVTDLLYRAQTDVSEGRGLAEAWNEVRSRFIQLAFETGSAEKLNPFLTKVERDLLDGCSASHAASRGEYLNGIILAHLLGFEFVDAAEVIRFDAEGRLDPVTYPLIAERCKLEGKYVIPGFYGMGPQDKIITFSRGGSDITGAIIANALDASRYENWTDVNGIMSTDPRIVPGPKQIPSITNKELRELTYAGATVFHDEAVAPVWEKKIPIHILNTNQPEDLGTVIVAERESSQTVVGIAGKPGFVVVNISSRYMHTMTGVAAAVLRVFSDLGISIEHAPTAIDEMSVVISSQHLQGKTELVANQIRELLPGAEVTFSNSLALIATVGLGMAKHPGTAAMLFAALSESRINVRLILQGASESNIIVGVDEKDLAQAVRGIYKKFF